MFSLCETTGYLWSSYVYLGKEPDVAAADQQLICRLAINESTTFDKDQVMCDVMHKQVYEDLSGKLVLDQESQTVYSKYELSPKVETIILKTEVSTSKLAPPKIVRTLSYENIVWDAVLMKHFMGLTPLQFEVLHNFLGTVCPLETIHYWTRKD